MTMSALTCATLALLALPATRADDPPDIARLIQQLGSPSFEEREAAAAPLESW
jgi:hypothetical protein